MRRGGRALAAVAALLVAATACASDPTGPVPEPPDRVAAPPAHDYLPGLPAFTHVPRGVTTAPVVLVVPGGSWRSSGTDGYQPLAAALAEAGAVAVVVRIRVADDGAHWPVPVEDVLCGLADAAATAREVGIEPGPLVVLGHSAGGHLAAVAALSAEDFDPGCRDERVAPDAVVGLAGPYDIRRFADPAQDLLGSPLSDGDARWRAANPLLLADRHPDVAFLLLHGAEDDVVDDAFTTDFAVALDEAGHPTTAAVLEGVDHQEVTWPSVVAAPVLRWLRTLTTPAGPG